MMRKIFILIISVLLLSFLILSILGNKTRVGYISDIKLNVEQTLKLNNINKNLFSDIHIDESFIKTNSLFTNYCYNFRVQYYDKIFRNSDIFDVYPDFSKILISNNYIKKTAMDSKGSPFGVLISDEIIDINKIDNVEYKLKIKMSFMLYSISIIFLILILYIIYVKIKKYIYICIYNVEYKIKILYSKINKHEKIYTYVCVFVYLFLLLLIMLINRQHSLNTWYMRAIIYIFSFVLFSIFIISSILLERKISFFLELKRSIVNILNDKLYISFLIAAFIIVYGFAVAQLTFDADDYVALYGMSAFSSMVQERFSFILFKTIFDFDIYLPYFFNILGVLLIFAGTILWNVFFNRMYNSSISSKNKIIFSILFTSHPILTYFSIFSFYTMGLIYLFSGFALVLFESFFKKKNIFTFILLLIMLLLSASLYEIAITFFVSGIIYGLLLYSINPNNNHDLKKYINYIILFVFVCLLALIFKKICSYILIEGSGFVRSHYLERTGIVQWNLKDIKSNFVILKELILPISILYKYNILPYAIILFVSSAIYSIKKKHYYTLILSIISIYTSIAIIILTGNVNLHLRPMTAILIFIAFSIYFAAILLDNIKYINRFVFIFAIFLFLIFAKETNINYLNHYRRYELDKFMTLNIINEIQKQNGLTNNKPIYFFGRFIGYDNLTTDKKDYPNVTFSSGIEVVGKSMYTIDFYGDIPVFFNYLNYPITLLENKFPELVDKAKMDGKDMLSYPMEGYVKTFDDYIVVKLGDN